MTVGLAGSIIMLAVVGFDVIGRSAMADDQNQALYDQWVRPRYVDKKWYYAQIQSLGRTDMSSCDNPFTVCWRSHDKLYPH